MGHGVSGSIPKVPLILCVPSALPRPPRAARPRARACGSPVTCATPCALLRGCDSVCRPGEPPSEVCTRWKATSPSAATGSRCVRRAGAPAALPLGVALHELWGCACVRPLRVHPVQTWRKRWFIVESGKLCYFDDQGGKLKGTVRGVAHLPRGAVAGCTLPPRARAVRVCLCSVCAGPLSWTSSAASSSSSRPRTRTGRSWAKSRPPTGTS